ncbi:magnetosome protein Mad6 [Candidatus Desulfarcum epimagneticum]|uniref:Magnetosome protein Mad6 n=1 Tax=uncultured Desulfobacteraceae bacterium TaxID=218296 RepID=A0A484HFR5_9BACT|nr:magnetosome protein Mad6 [uncultured Desulfobacteraceae bacterium]
MAFTSFRRVCQTAGTALSNGYLSVFLTHKLNNSMTKGFCVPILNCYSCPLALFSCPIGTIQHFAAFHVFPFYPLALLGLVGILVGRMSCGWICPFGLVQDLLYKVKLPKFDFNPNLGYIKYLVLLVFVFALPYQTGELWFSKLCPSGTLFASIPWFVWNPIDPGTGQPTLPGGPGVIFYVDLILLAIFLAWFMVTKRPFCRIFCPLGAIFSLFNKISFIQLKVDHACDGCERCESLCPVGINVHKTPNSPDCIRCLECVACEHVSVTTAAPFPKDSFAKNIARDLE